MHLNMGNQREAIPDQIPQHPSQAEDIDGEITLGKLMEGEKIDLSIIMRWAEAVNKYAYELTPPPEPPLEFEEPTPSEIKNVLVSEYSSEELVILIGWYWYHSGKNKYIFREDRSKEQENETRSVGEIKKSYPIIHRFDTELDRINMNGLKISVCSQDLGGIDWNHVEQVERSEGEAAIFYPPDMKDVAVLLFDNGRGYYCCHSEGDVNPVDKWFRTEFNNWVEENIVPLQFDE